MDTHYLQLGDIIRIVSPKEPSLHDQTFYVYYYDPLQLLEVVHTSSMQIFQFPLKDGMLIDDSPVENIIILNRSIHKGFARQNGLVKGAWIELEFGGEHRVIVTGLITHLVEDMIQITSFPEDEVLYIDFGYKGIPKNIPLKKICTRQQPISYSPISGNGDEKEEEKDETGIIGEDDAVLAEYNDQGEMEMKIPAKLNLEKDYREELHEEYIEHLSQLSPPDSYQSEVVLKPHQIKYDVDVQMNELLDDFLYKLPEEKRTRRAMREVYIHINRFKELREKCSLFDIHHQITGFQRHDPQHYKPLVESLYNLDTNIPWIYPVVSMSRELYGNNLEEAVEKPYNDCSLFNIEVQVQAEIDTVRNLFWENDTPATTNRSKYADMHDQVAAQYWRPVSHMEDLIQVPIASNLRVGKDTDMILAHDSSLRSTVVKPFGKEEYAFKRQKCVMSRFNEPITYPHYIGRNMNESRVLMEPDAIDLNSLIIMPESFVTQSVLISPTSTILEKCNYHLPRVTPILKNIQIQKKEIKLTATTENIFPLESAITHVTLEPREEPLFDERLAHPTFQAYLQAMIPSTFAVIDKYQAKNEHNYCLTDYLKTLSPYGLHHDTISFGASQRIRKHLLQNISNYYADYLKKRDTFGNYAVEKFKIVEPKTPILPRLFTDTYFLGSHAILQDFQASYRRKNTMPSSSELCNSLGMTNDFRLFSYWILLSNLILVSPQMMLEPYVEPKHFYDATQRAIAKKYLTLRKMQDDNDNRDIRYDTEYDANQYDALAKYKKERGKMTPDEFIEYLSQKLAEDYGCSMDNTTDLAKDLIQGYKLVKDGDYALLEIKPQLPAGVEECTFSVKEKEEITIEANVRKIQKYFKRVNHTWIFDPDMDASSFGKTKDLTCALKENYQKRFTNQYGANMEEIETKIKAKIDTEKRHLKMTWERGKNTALQFDKAQIKLGHKAYISETLPSPHKNELDGINHKSIDFAVKQKFLVSFRQIRCRDPLPLQENQHWLYCIDSDSIPLMPKSQFLLAKAFLKGDYTKVLKELIKSSGRVCDGYYVDRFCGNVLDQIDYSEQGLELLTEVDEQDTWEPDSLDDSYKVDEHSQKKLYKNTKMRHVHNIMLAICKNLFVSADNVENMTMSLCMDFMGNTDIFIGDERYAKRMKDRKKKDDASAAATKTIPYETYYQSILLDVLVCSLIVALQTVVPSLSPRRTFGDCVKNMDGYPLSEDSGNMGTIEYLSCVLRKMQEDKKTMPWKTIMKKKGNMESRLQHMFTTHILKNDRVSELIKEKRKYIVNFKDSAASIPAHLQIDKSWPRFLPPIKPTDILGGKVPLKNINASVHDELKKYLKSGHQDQWKLLGMYFCKILSFSFGTLEAINVIVKDKGNLLGKYAKAPIVENACCHDLDKSYIPIVYFKEEDERVALYINSIEKLGAAMDKTVQFIRPAFLHAEKKQAEVPDNTKRSIFCQHSEYLMYRTLIKYCNLDSDVKPIPSFLESFLSEKPKEFNPLGSIEEKIAYLKEQGKSLNLASFTSLMNQINRHNMVTLQSHPEVTYQDRVISSLDAWRESIQDHAKLQSMYDHFRKYVDREKIGSLDEDEDKKDPANLKTELLDQFENSLQTHIDDMKKDIVRFMEDLDVRTNVIKKTMSMFDEWDEDLSYVTFGHFTKNYIYYICALMPNYVIKGKKARKNVNCLNLMRDDAARLKYTLDEKYDNLKKFKRDPYLRPFMRKVKTSLKPMYDFMSKFYGFFPQDRQSLYGRYFQFCLVFIFHYFVQNSENEAMLTDVIQGIQADEDGDEDGDGDGDGDGEDSDDEREGDMEVADKGSVQTRLLELIQTLLKGKNIFDRDRKTTLFTYKNIRKNVERLEGAEKKRMMDGFKNIKDIKTRRSELLLKKYHLGKFFVDPNVIKKYGKKRDKMLNTEDITETDFLYGANEVTEDDVEDLIEDMRYDVDETLEILPPIDFGSDDDDDDDYDDEAQFLQQPVEDDDANDIAENASDNL